MAGGPPTDKYSFLYQTDSSHLKSKSRLSSTMNPVYSPVQPGTPYGNPKNMTYTGYPGGYPTAAPAYTPSLYQTGSPGYPPGKYSPPHSQIFTRIHTCSGTACLVCARMTCRAHVGACGDSGWRSAAACGSASFPGLLAVGDKDFPGVTPAGSIVVPSRAHHHRSAVFHI
ncbi:hypothetical protein AOLI_G00092830 [Acnodon oligacanthus]